VLLPLVSGQRRKESGMALLCAALSILASDYAETL